MWLVRSAKLFTFTYFCRWTTLWNGLLAVHHPNFSLFVLPEAEIYIPRLGHHFVWDNSIWFLTFVTDYICWNSGYAVNIWFESVHKQLISSLYRNSKKFKMFCPILYISKLAGNYYSYCTLYWIDNLNHNIGSCFAISCVYIAQTDHRTVISSQIFDYRLNKTAFSNLMLHFYILPFFIHMCLLCLVHFLYLLYDNVSH